jgi:glucose-1-phosphate thymidylyltransferase
MIKKIVIAAAGKGTRMGELSRNLPKHLIPVAGKPFIYYLLKNIKEAGFEEIYLVVGHLKERFDKFVNDYQEEFNLIVIDQHKKVGDKYGSATPLIASREYLDDDFVYLMGDNLYSVEDLQIARGQKENTLFTMFTNCPAKYSDTKTDESGNFLDFVVNRQAPPGPAWGNSGLYVFKKEVLSLLDNIKEDPLHKEFTVTSLFEKIKDISNLKVEKLVGDWLDFGAPEDVNKLEKYLKNKK